MSLARGQPTRYACAVVPGFPAATLVRVDPGLRGHPLAACVRVAGVRQVVAVTPQAARGGARPGMSASEAAVRVPGLIVRDRDPAAERAATQALHDAAWATSPRIEALGSDGVTLDLTGLGGVGVEPHLGRALRERLAALGLPVQVGMADTRTAALLAARCGSTVTRVPPGETGAFIAPFPVAALEPPPDLAASLTRWGIRTLGALARLPSPALITRLGVEGARLQSRARGEDPGPFVPLDPPVRWIEALALDWEVASLEALAFVLRRLVEPLAARLAVRDRGATALALTLTLSRPGGLPTAHDAGSVERRLVLPAPCCEPRTLLALILAAFDGVRLPAPVVGLALDAEAAPLSTLQGDLFVPSRPSQRELGETLARLAALVGTGQVGAPRLDDTHRPDRIGMEAFPSVEAERARRRSGPPRRASRSSTPPVPTAAPRRPVPPAEAPAPAASGEEPAGAPPHFAGTALVCRRLVPPLPAIVTCEDGRPARVEAPGAMGPVLAAAGPWRTTGEWWADTAWAREEWDVALPGGALYRLAVDRTTGAWSIEAIYD